MKQALDDQRVTEFSTEDVTDWKHYGQEEIDGEMYEVGLVSMEINSLFGKHPRQAKALFKNGKLIKWVWAENHFEIK